MDKSVISITFCKYQDTSRDRSSDNLWAFLSPWQSFSICIICTFRWKHSYSLVKLHWLRDYWAPLFSHLTKVELHLRSGWEVIHCLLPILNSFLLTYFCLNLVYRLNCNKDNTRIKLIRVDSPRPLLYVTHLMVSRLSLLEFSASLLQYVWHAQWKHSIMLIYWCANIF